MHLFYSFYWAMCHLIPFLFSRLYLLKSCHREKSFFDHKNPLKSPTMHTKVDTSRERRKIKFLHLSAFCAKPLINCTTFPFKHQVSSACLLSIFKGLIYDFYPHINIWSEDKSQVLNDFNEKEASWRWIHNPLVISRMRKMHFYSIFLNTKDFSS